MKKYILDRVIFVTIALLTSLAAMAGPNDFIFMQRNAADSGNVQRVIASPATTGFFTYNAATKLGGYTTLGNGLTLDGGVLSAAVVPGPKGDTGATGATGAAGRDGVDGAPGVAGATGSTGAKGDKGDTVVGPAGASAYQIAVANGYSGTESQWLAFLSGKSAYQLAAAAGYQGTMVQWLASLKGADGATGLTGATGATGATGPAGASIKGDKGDKGDPGTPAPTTLRLRAQTSTTGVYTWTFATPFPAGTVPVVGVTVEDSSTASWNHAVSNVTNTGFTVTLGKTTAVTVVGVSVLGVASNPQAYVHLTATAP